MWTTRILSLVGLVAISIKTAVAGVGPETVWAYMACIYVATDAWLIEGLRRKTLTYKDERIALLETNVRLQGELLDASKLLLKGDYVGAKPHIDAAQELADSVDALRERGWRT